MNVLIIGNREEEDRVRKRFPGQNYITRETEAEFDGTLELIIWFSSAFPVDKSRITDVPIMLEVSFNSLDSLKIDHQGLFLGFTSLRTFFERDVFEISCINPKLREDIDSLMSELNCDFELVKDRVGLITPRVISMIINEAYYTVEDHTASREDIDTAMKLGTNYPMGPFEWAEKIGVSEVHQLLNAVYKETGEERYKPCNLLKSES